MLSNSGERIKVNSAHRSHSHNKRVGGVKDSWHLHKCGARDIHKPYIKNKKAFIKYVIKSGYRIIEYRNHYHIDVDEPGYFKSKRKY